MDVRCQRPGCSGKIVDGFCEDCGRPPVGKTAAPPPPAVPSAASTRTGSVGTAGTGTGGTGSGLLSGRTGSGKTGRSSSRGARASSRRLLGAGLVSLPAVPSQDPLQAVLANPVVPDRKRFCNNCGAKLNHEKGFCPMCGNEYSFLPTLKAGDIVADQYEVKGAIAFGGLGWIYLGWDKTLSRWVVLKGLLNSKDEASAAAALAERRFLAAVKHPKIVGVYNFVSHGSEGYIVMEYVGGKTIKALRQEQGPLPVPEAIAYIYAILPAFAYMERMGLVYCDFKPDNFMLEDDDVKLIDMGGVRRIDDTDGDIYGTKGYTAPEANQTPSFTSDLYTIARTLAILIMDFKFQGAYEYSLPTPQEEPLFEQYDSLYRFLLKATRQNPDDRFQTADEMGEQLLGVLREIVSQTGVVRPAESSYFFGEAMIEQGGETQGIASPSPAILPALKVDTLDPAAGAILTLGAAAVALRIAGLELAMQTFPESSEAPLRLAWVHIEAGNFAAAEKLLAAVEARDSFDWRPRWYRGRSLLAQKRYKEAQETFDWVYSELPGELAPKLAYSLAAELNEDLRGAIRYYDVVSRTDPNMTSAAFGLARALAKMGDRNNAVNAYGRVAATSIFYAQAQIALARALLRSEPTAPGEKELVQAAQAIQALKLDGMALHRLSADLFLTAIERVESKGLAPSANARLLDQELNARALRLGAERELRACAHHAETYAEKIALVDQANQVRPRTLF